MDKSIRYVFNIKQKRCYSVLRKGKENQSDPERNPIKPKQTKQKEEPEMKKLVKFLEEYYKTIVAPKW